MKKEGETRSRLRLDVPVVVAGRLAGGSWFMLPAQVVMSVEELLC